MKNKLLAGLAAVTASLGFAATAQANITSTLPTTTVNEGQTFSIIFNSPTPFTAGTGVDMIVKPDPTWGIDGQSLGRCMFPAGSTIATCPVTIDDQKVNLLPKTAVTLNYTGVGGAVLITTSASIQVVDNDKATGPAPVPTPAPAPVPTPTPAPGNNTPAPSTDTGDEDVYYPVYLEDETSLRGRKLKIRVTGMTSYSGKIIVKMGSRRIGERWVYQSKEDYTDKTYTVTVTRAAARKLLTRGGKVTIRFDGYVGADVDPFWIKRPYIFGY